MFDGNPSIAYRLYLPEEWAADSERRCKTGVPEEILLAAEESKHSNGGGLAGRISRTTSPNCSSGSYCDCCRCKSES
jgi:hypothetical protein